MCAIHGHSPPATIASPFPITCQIQATGPEQMLIHQQLLHFLLSLKSFLQAAVTQTWYNAGTFVVHRGNLLWGHASAACCGSLSASKSLCPAPHCKYLYVSLRARLFTSCSCRLHSKTPENDRANLLFRVDVMLSYCISSFHGNIAINDLHCLYSHGAAACD